MPAEQLLRPSTWLDGAAGPREPEPPLSKSPHLLAVVAALVILAGLPGCRRRARFGTPTYGGSYQGAPAQQRGGVQWTRAAPDNAGFEVQMPVRYRMDGRNGHDDDGARTATATVVGEAQWGYFGVVSVWFEGGIVGDPVPGTVELARGIFDRGELDLEASRRLAVEGFYAREDTGADSRGAFVALRQFVGRDRVIMAVAVVPRNSREALGVAEHFMRSIRLDSRYALFPRQGTRRSGGAWTPLYVPELDFGVRLPSSPEIEGRDMQIADAAAHVTTFGSQDEWGTFRVRVITFERGVPDDAVDDVCERLRLTEEVRPVHASGFPGRVYTGDGGSRRSIARVFLTLERIYVVQATGPRARIGDAAVRAHLRDFFDSFRIL